MNFIAHLILSPKDPYYIAGNLAADFLNGADRKRMSARVRQGISMHHFVDRFTDTHDIVKKSKDRIKTDFRLLSGILIDVFYDHFLARHFDDIANMPLDLFCSHIYETLDEHIDELPSRLQRFVPIMIEENVLRSYREIEGINLAFTRINRRIKKKIDAGSATAALRDNYESLERDFNDFFPELIAATADYRKGYGTFL